MSDRRDLVEVHGLKVSRFLKGQLDALTLGGAVTLLNEDGVIWAADAGGSSRNVTLPARAAVNDGQIRIIINVSTAGENLVIKNSSATTLLTLPSSGVALVIAAVAAEAPGTREWVAVPIGGEDLAIADDLTVTGDLSVTGPATLSSTLGVGLTGTFSSNVSVSSTLGVGKTATFSSNIAVSSTLDAQAVFSAKTPTIGKATSDVVGFFGGTGSSQRAGSNQASSNLSSSASFGTLQQAIVQEIMATLTAASLWKGSA